MTTENQAPEGGELPEPAGRHPEWDNDAQDYRPTGRHYTADQMRAALAAQPAQTDDNWRQYATERETTAQQVIERHRREIRSALRQWHAALSAKPPVDPSACLEALRAHRDTLPFGEERSAFNAAIDRLDVAISKEIHADPAEGAVTDDMRSAVRWAPSSAYWSERLREFFGPDAREGIDALERQLSAALASQPQPKGTEDAGGPHLRKLAARLLTQLADNRPRRALDLEATRQVLEAIAAPANADKLIADLTRNAWEWGVSCEIDDVRWGEAGDSHNQMWRDQTAAAASRLQAALLTTAQAHAKGDAS